MVAVIAARTRMHSKPSRKTRMPMSSAAALNPKCGPKGSGLPAWPKACQIRTAATERPATDRAAREAIRDAEFEPRAQVILEPGCRGFRITPLTPDHYISDAT